MIYKSLVSFLVSFQTGFPFLLILIYFSLLLVIEINKFPFRRLVNAHTFITTTSQLPFVLPCLPGFTQDGDFNAYIFCSYVSPVTYRYTFLHLFPFLFNNSLPSNFLSLF